MSHHTMAHFIIRFFPVMKDFALVMDIIIAKR